MTTSVLVIHDTPERYFASLAAQFPGLAFHKARTDGELLEQMAAGRPEILLSFRCDGISTAAQTRAAHESCVKWIQVAGAGHDHLGELEELSCPVTNCGGVLSRFQAETVIGAVINLNFGFFRYQEQQRHKIYRKLPWNSLEGQNLLIIGFGHIGKAVARNGRHFGMRITVVRSRGCSSPEADAVYTPDKLPELLPEADFVSLHLPHNDFTDQFFNKEMFAAMKSSAYFINSARGGVVHEQDLIDALTQKQIAGAYLDVFNEEPLPPSSPLWNLDNVLLTPHYCDAVTDWHERFATFFSENLEKWLAGKSLQNLIKE